MIFPIVIKYHHRKKNHIPPATESFASGMEIDGFVDLGFTQPIRTSMKAWDGSQDIIKGMLFKSLSNMKINAGVHFLQKFGS
jgi:hypothetical protein